MARLDDRLDREFDPRTAKVLAKALDVHTVGELLRHYPRRYEQRGELTDLGSLRDGTSRCWPRSPPSPPAP
jgi:ATP-dependent DNA helicase RecG